MREVKKKLEQKHLLNEIDTLEKVEKLIIESPNMKSLILNPLCKIYKIEKKKENLKEFYTARLNEKLRLYMKPQADYPYDNLEQIIEIKFVTIDDKHYGDG